jgi:3D (Asp-Asp-Asp) domain-containing protein
MAKLNMQSATARRSSVIKLVDDALIHSQSDLVRELNRLGHSVTQATASRDLEEFYSPGDSICIMGAGEYDGMWMVADRMNRRWSNKIDLLVNNDSYVDRFTDVRIIKHVRK